MSATKSPPSRPNLFAAELRSFLFPLLARWSQPDVGAAKWAVAEPALLGHLTQCAGKLLECAGRASADRDAAIPLCLDLVEFTWINQDPHVRRCSVFLFSRVLLVGGETLAVAREEVLGRMEVALLYEPDDVCRKMVQGVLACVEQYQFQD